MNTARKYRAFSVMAGKGRQRVSRASEHTRAYIGYTWRAAYIHGHAVAACGARQRFRGRL